MQNKTTIFGKILLWLFIFLGVVCFNLIKIDFTYAVDPIATEDNSSVPSRTFPLSEAGIKTSQSESVEKLANNFIILMGSTVGFFAILGIIVGGIILMTAFWVEEKIQTGKTIILYSVLGLVFTLGAYIIVSFVQTIIYSLGDQ